MFVCQLFLSYVCPFLLVISLWNDLIKLDMCSWIWNGIKMTVSTVSKQDWNDFQTFEARALTVCYVCEIISVCLVWKYLSMLSMNSM